jgi:hypothetical protein
MQAVSLTRLYMLRIVYLILAVGLAVAVWPGVIHHAKPWGAMQGFVNCMLAAFGLLCALGVRYPLQMLPVLLWELTWKTLWVLVVALPAWQAGPLDPAMMEDLFAVSIAIIIPIAMPWGYVYNRYLKQPGDRWRTAASN